MSTPREEQPQRAAGLNPAALSVTDTARTLTRVGGQPITEAMIERDIEDGAPTNADGTINLVHYAAWLVRDMGEAGGSRGD
ncbi:MAG: hypothetical protein KJZ69_09435 [Phycisphaerales bacterium]|nr:hypothetical protein [Phycisphaerales bacterium]